MGTNGGLPTVLPDAAARAHLVLGATASVGKEAVTEAVVEEEVAVVAANSAMPLSLSVETVLSMEVPWEARGSTVKWRRNTRSGK